MSVAASREPAVVGTQLDPAEHEHGRPGGHAAGDESESLRQLVARDADLECNRGHGV